MTTGIIATLMGILGALGFVVSFAWSLLLDRAGLR